MKKTFGILAALAALLTAGCFQEYPGDPKPDPNAKREIKPNAAAPDRSNASQGR